MIFLFIGSELSCYDSLTISGGASKEFCGTTTPQSFVPGLNVVTLRMVSDGSVEQTGFDLNFKTVQSKRYFQCVRGCQRDIGRWKEDWFGWGGGGGRRRQINLTWWHNHHKDPVELHSRPDVSTLQTSVFIRGDLKSQRGFLYTEEMTSFATKVEILLW